MAQITLFYQGKLYKTALTQGEIIYGSGKKEDPSLNLPKNSRITLQYSMGILLVYAKNIPGFIDGRIESGRVTLLSEDSSAMILWTEDRRNANETLKIPYMGLIKIGRDPDNHIVLRDPEHLISRHHATIRVEDGIVHLEDGQDGTPSSHGVYVNGKKVDKALIHQNDVIDLMSIRIRLLNGELHFENVGGALTINFKGSDALPTTRSSQKSQSGQRPKYHRSPRYREEMPHENIILSRPPARPQQYVERRGMFTSLISSGAMMAATAAMGVVSPALLAARAASLVSPVSMLAMNRSANKKGKAKAEEYQEERYEKYSLYIDGQLARILQIAEKQRQILQNENPPPSVCMEMADKLDCILWSRHPEDNDFMSVRLGMGYEELCVKVVPPSDSQTFQMESDEAEELAQEIIETTRLVDQVPVRVSLKTQTTVGIIGQRNHVVQLVYNMIVSLTSLHYYQDLKIVGLFDRSEYEAWKSLRWLPHVQDESRQIRYLAFDQPSRDRILDLFEDQFKERLRQLHDNEPITGPHYLFILGSKEFERLDFTERWLLANRPELGITTLFLFDEHMWLPYHCRYEINLDDKNYPSAFEVAALNRKFCFTPDPALAAGSFDRYCRYLSAIEVEERVRDADIPGSITFLQGYHADDVQALNSWQRWTTSDPSVSLSAPFAAMSGGRTFSLDIHEKHHGPHGLVAGTSGSGKSELLASWLLALAVNYNPEDVSLLVIDYKGGGLANTLEGLPHMVGKITNLDSNLFRSLISLNAEKNRRMALFAQANVNRIDDYQAAYHAGKVPEPLPHLLVVTDEFRELKKNEPEFLNALISISVVGRSLGIHLVLATQSPNGVVDDLIRDNAHFKICLKVENAAASRDMIGRNDAAKLTQIGRAYIQIGNDEIYEMVQSFWCGAPYIPGHTATEDSGNQVRLVSISGERIKTIEDNKTRFKSELTELDAISRYLSETARAHSIKRMKCPWLPELPATLLLDELNVPGAFNGSGWPGSLPWLKIPVGMYDLPAAQTQGVQYIDLAEEGHYGIYGASGTGKTSALKTILTSAALWYSPKDLQIIILDFGGWSMNVFADLPHIGAIGLDYEQDKIQQIINYLEEEIDRRRKAFSACSIGTLKDYRTAVSDEEPAILLAIDNLPALLSTYPNYLDFLVRLARESASLGIYMIYTANSLNGVSYKLASSIGGTILFEPTDRNDYTTLVGRPKAISGMPPISLQLPKVKGRAYFKGNEPIEFQCALYAAGKDDLERSEGLKTMIQKMLQVQSSPYHNRVKTVPDEITQTVLAPYYETDSSIPIGFRIDTVEPDYLSLGDRYIAVVTGKPGCGKSRLLCDIGRLVHVHNPESHLYVLDSSSHSLSALQTIAAGYSTADNLDSIDVVLSNLLNTLLHREKEKGTVCSWPLVLLLIDDIRDLISQIPEKQKQTLITLARSAKNLSFAIIESGQADDFTELSDSDQLIFSALSNQNGIALSGTPGSYRFFPCKLDYSAKNAECKPGYALHFLNGECHTIAPIREVEP